MLDQNNNDSDNNQNNMSEEKENKFICQIMTCHKSFPTQRGLNTHMIHHRIKNKMNNGNYNKIHLECHYCGVKYTSKRGLSVHLSKTHSLKAKLYQCRHCLNNLIMPLDTTNI